MNAKILVRVVEWRKRNKPLTWIARQEGLDVRDVRAILRIAGDPKWNVTELSLDRYDQMEYLVNQDAPLTEITRTVRCDNRTVKNWFPDAGRKRGSKESADLDRKMRELEERRDLL